MLTRTVLVFKTSVTHRKEVMRLRPLLNTLIDRDGHWNFDLEDCDHILRIETQELHAVTVSSALQVEGFYCKELSE